MKSWFTERATPSPGTTDDELPGWPIPPGSRACCCPATAAFIVIMPSTAARRHSVDLLLCGHHYWHSEAALRAAGATVYDRSGKLVVAASGAQPAFLRASASADEHQVSR